ncbi:MAG: strawberry notch C-terminal domain-containing protein, partial [Rhodospirillales bacterium]|nr:strawberry notch C-terminal domain-containing protein [Rhodospirillales bacterium]
TPFEKRTDFVSAMESGGVAAMEVVARDLKALGLYQARALSYDGVEVELLEHALTDEQRRIYDSYAQAFKIIHANLQQALESTGICSAQRTLNRNAKAAAMSAFEGAKQRFFGHLLTSMKCPALIRAVEADRDAGRASVIQLVSTGEALMERRIAEVPTSEWNDLNIDLTPRESILSYLAHAFPVQLQQPFTDEEGNLMSRPVFDDDGNPVLSQEAVAARDTLIERLAALPPVPAALDQILHHFGHEAVAEVTGRSRRVLRIVDASGERMALKTRPASANLSETAAFMEGAKKILVFSMAGGTGRSYHAALDCGNTARRVHYLLEPGWRAEQAIQGLGRTHRTHQASAPVFRPVTTDVKGERRFIATIARRLDSLGALTRGQRDSQTSLGGADAALFKASDNLESPYARAALRQFYGALWAGYIDGWSLDRFEKATGLKLAYDGNLKEDLPPMPKFLNRLLALPIDEQNTLFAELETRIDANIEQAMEAGTYEQGVENILADSLRVASSEELRTHERTGAATELVEIARRERLEPLTADAALRLRDQALAGGGKTLAGGNALAGGDRAALMVNARSRRAAVRVPAPSRMLDDGGIQARVRLLRPASRDTAAAEALAASHWRDAGETQWRALWDAEVQSLPTHTESRLWLVTGLLLPVWDRLPKEDLRVRRLRTDDGGALIGRVLNPEQATALRTAFGLSGGPALSAAEVHEALTGRGTPFGLANGWRLMRRRLMGADRIEIEGPVDTDLPVLKRLGCVTEIVSWRTRVFAPDAETINRLLDRYPLDGAAA